jgi:hypothetical protein
VYLFDDVTAVKLDKYFFSFFKRPLNLNGFAEPIPYNTEDALINPNITAWDFRWYNDFIQCFAVVNSTIYRYEFTFDISKTKVSTKAFFVNF